MSTIGIDFLGRLSAQLSLYQNAKKTEIFKHRKQRQTRKIMFIKLIANHHKYKQIVYLKLLLLIYFKF